MLENSWDYDEYEPAPIWLNKSFIEDALKQYRNDDTLQVESIEIKPGTTKGESYASLMFRCKANFTTGKLNGIINSFSFIIKTSHDENSYGYKLLIKFDVYNKELEMYECILPKIRSLLKAAKSCKNDIFATTIYVNYSKRAIFFEDLSLKGYRMAPRCNGLDILHTKIVLKKLAKFHAGGAMLAIEQPDVYKNFQHGMNSRDGGDTFEEYYLSDLDAMINLISTWDNYTYYVEKLKKLKENLMDYVKLAFDAKLHNFNTLIHGDNWTNNMMFTYNENNEPDKIMLVDFQFSCWASPTIDLHYYFNTSLTNDLRFNHQEELVLYYYRCLVRTLNDLKFTGRIPSLREFYMDFIENSIYAFTSALLVQPVMLNENSENADIEGLFGNNARCQKFKEQVYSNEKVHNNIRALLPFFDRKGILD